MINGNGVHLPDTTYGGNPINWNCSSDSDDSLQRLKAENAKLRELIADLWEYIYIGTERDGQSLHDRTRELGVEV